MDVVTPQPWEVAGTLRGWQVSAIEAWEQERAGIIEAGTGTGKTMVALEILSRLRLEQGENLRTAVIVPTIALARQWQTNLVDQLNVPRHLIGELHSAAVTRFDPDEHQLVVAVLASAARHLPEIVNIWRRHGRFSCLVVDECHRSASHSARRIFTSACDARLGLSATPDRDDGADETVLYPNLGDIVYRYGLLDALDHGIVAPAISINLYIDFTPHEQGLWDDLTAEIGRQLESLIAAHPHLKRVDDKALFTRISQLAERDPRAAALLSLVRRRGEVLSRASSRHQLLEALQVWVGASERKAIFFHETIATATSTYNALRRAGAAAALDHSELSKNVRAQQLRRFGTDRFRHLVAVKALDEGIDVPAADVAVIAQGTRSRRQRIQRIGRVLRAADDKTALVFTVLVRGTPEEFLIGARDEALLGSSRVRHHRWPRLELKAVVPDERGVALSSSYLPESDRYRPDTKLTDASCSSEVGLLTD